MHVSGDVSDFDNLVSEYSTEGLIENHIYLTNPYERECNDLFNDCYLYGVLRFSDKANELYKLGNKQFKSELKFFKSDS